MRLSLFEYALLFHPKGKKKRTEIIDQDSFLETDMETAKIRVHREIPEEYMDKLDQVEILIRPF